MSVIAGNLGFYAVDTDLNEVHEANAASARKAGYLCGHCAETLGGRWPRGHRATFHVANCPVCKSSRPLAAWDDWSWPKSKGHNFLAKKIREV